MKENKSKSIYSVKEINGKENPYYDPKYNEYVKYSKKQSNEMEELNNPFADFFQISFKGRDR